MSKYFFFFSLIAIAACSPVTKNTELLVNTPNIETSSNDTIKPPTANLTINTIKEVPLKLSTIELLQNELTAIDNITANNNFILNTDIILRLGDSNQYVSILKKRIYNLPDSAISSMKFDNQLDSAVKAFQYKHALYADGIVGKNTYYFLNQKDIYYKNTLKANIDRLKLSNDTIAKNGIYINIPEYTLQLFQNDTLLFETEVIVGKKKTYTPTLSSEINYLVYNPCWTVPNSIASEKMLPKLQSDSMYLQNRNMFICQNGIEVNPCDIDFSQYSQSNFPFKIFQRTGTDNALGKVKFMFDNKYSIYLHDTPSKNLFYKQDRAFSHGCIRVNNALSLAQTLLNNDKKSIVNTQHYLNLGYPVKVFLNHPIPITITYYTCTVDSNNIIIYHKDIYNLDKQK